MSASQLLRILQTLPAAADDDICAIDTDEQETSTIRSSRSCTNPFLSDEENKKCNFWNNPELETSIFENDFTNNQENEMFRKSTTPFFDKSTGFYFDNKNTTVEYELPELMVCYQESDFQVKDIGTDKCIPDEETIVYNSNPVSEDGDDMIEASLDSDFLNHEWLIRPSYITNFQEKLNSTTNLEDDVSTESSNISADDVDQQTLQRSEAENVINKSKMEGSIYELPLDTRSAVNRNYHDEAMVVSNDETRYVGESSFSMAGVITELISCSRPITFSAGISITNQSDSCTTSTRSFAFPTLEAEYNSSPVRMGKAERKRLRKQKGWGQGLLCCRF